MFSDDFPLGESVKRTLLRAFSLEMKEIPFDSMDANEALVKVLKKSHEQVMNGDAAKMDKLERFINSCPKNVQIFDEEIQEKVNAVRKVL